MVRLVRPFGWHAEVFGLFLRKLGQLGQLDSYAIQVQAGDFFVQFLGEAIDADFVGRAVGPEVQLREDLVGEAVAHHKNRMTGRSVGARECDWRN